MLMGSSSGTSSPGSWVLQNSGSEEDLQQIMDQRKRKRMISNRESARRSRMRKQKHLDDLMGQVSQMRKENDQIVTYMNITTQNYLNVEAENSILRAQIAELSNRLQSLNEIISVLNSNNMNTCGFGVGGGDDESNYNYDISHQGEFVGAVDGFLVNNNSWNFLSANQPIITSASADILQY